MLTSIKVRADWVRSGKDGVGQKWAEVEGHAYVYWAGNEPDEDQYKNAEIQTLTFKRQTHRIMKQFSDHPENLLNWTSPTCNKVPIKITFCPKEDDGNNKEDDSLGTKTVIIDYKREGPVNKYTELREDRSGTVDHTRHRFGFKFSYEVKKHLVKDVKI